MEPAMTDAAVHLAATASRCTRWAEPLGRSLRQAVLARRTRRALDRLPDDLLRDIAVTRSEIPFVAGALASRRGDPSRDAFHRLNRNPAERAAPARRWPRVVFGLALAAAVAASAFVVAPRAVLAQDAKIERGKYLVTLGGCTDCHTPGYFFGKPDMARYLGGSEVGFEIPGLGVFHGPNLTPDRDTGLGQWSPEEIATAITTGKRPDGRVLAPIMPWHAFAKLTRQDVLAIAAFLKSLPPVKNKVPGPFGPNDKPTSFVMKIVPPEKVETGGAAPK
jgi:mono/diheme cytochrome c family protein